MEEFNTFSVVLGRPMGFHSPIVFLSKEEVQQQVSASVESNTPISSPKSEPLISFDEVLTIIIIN
jgi:hypothetical protein